MFEVLYVDMSGPVQFFLLLLIAAWSCSVVMFMWVGCSLSIFLCVVLVL